LSGGRCFRLSVGPDRRCSGPRFLGQRPDPASAFWVSARIRPAPLRVGADLGQWLPGPAPARAV